jgi:cystathionine beta-lyase/cystathionine gamma-synthase
VVRGIQTLALRVRQTSANATAVAAVLATAAAGPDATVRAVHHPSRADHPQHHLVEAVLSGTPGALLSFDLGSRRRAEAFADACEVFVRAASLGGTHSLVLHPATTTHRQLDDEALGAAGLGAGTVRMSVGIEDAEDLLEDVGRALAAARAIDT